MPKNIGDKDRLIRFIAGAILLFLPLFAGWNGFFLGWVLPVIGIVLIITAFMRTCPAYIPLKIDTRKDKI